MELGEMKNLEKMGLNKHFVPNLRPCDASFILKVEACCHGDTVMMKGWGFLQVIQSYIPNTAKVSLLGP